MAKKRPSIDAILAQMSDEVLFPDIVDIVIALRKSKDLSIKDTAPNMNVGVCRARQLEKGSNYSLHELRRYLGDGLGLPDGAVRKVVAEYKKRQDMKRPEELSAARSRGAIDTSDIRAALAFYDRTEGDLAAVIGDKNDFSEHMRYHHAFREESLVNVLNGFRALLNDPAYDSYQLLQDAKRPIHVRIMENLKREEGKGPDRSR